MYACLKTPKGHARRVKLFIYFQFLPLTLYTVPNDPAPIRGPINISSTGISQSCQINQSITVNLNTELLGPLSSESETKQDLNMDAMCNTKLECFYSLVHKTDRYPDIMENRFT